MKLRVRAACWMTAASLLLAASAGIAEDPPAPAESGPLKLVTSIDLGGVQGRIDHLALDPAAKRLVVACLGHGTLEVLDPAEGMVMKTIDKLPEASGVVYLPGDRLAVTSAGDGIVQMVDTRSYSKDHKITVGADADNVRAETTADGATRLWVGWGEGALALVDPGPEKPRKVTDVKLEGHPESFQIETKGKRIFVNVPAGKHVAVVDRERKAVVAKWPLEAGANFPMALDEDGKRLFVGCRAPAKVLVLDTTTGKQIASVEISRDVDDLWWDATNKCLWAACGEGFIDSVVPTNEACTAWERKVHFATTNGARTCLFDPATGRIYLACPRGREHPSAEVRVYDTRK